MSAEFVAIYPVNRKNRVFIPKNDTALLECVVIVPNNDASAEISWNRLLDDGREDTVSHFAPGNNVLRIQNAGLEDAGIYRCRVITSESGQSLADIQLIVVSKSWNL